MGGTEDRKFRRRTFADSHKTRWRAVEIPRNLLALLFDWKRCCVNFAYVIWIGLFLSCPTVLLFSHPEAYISTSPLRSVALCQCCYEHHSATHRFKFSCLPFRLSNSAVGAKGLRYQHCQVSLCISESSHWWKGWAFPHDVISPILFVTGYKATAADLVKNSSYTDVLDSHKCTIRIWSYAASVPFVKRVIHQSQHDRTCMDPTPISSNICRIIHHWQHSRAPDKQVMQYRIPESIISNFLRWKICPVALVELLPEQRQCPNVNISTQSRARDTHIQSL
jgi:hypothetical protein